MKISEVRFQMMNKEITSFANGTSLGAWRDCLPLINIVIFFRSHISISSLFHFDQNFSSNRISEGGTDGKAMWTTLIYWLELIKCWICGKPCVIKPPVLPFPSSPMPSGNTGRRHAQAESLQATDQVFEKNTVLLQAPDCYKWKQLLSIKNGNSWPFSTLPHSLLCQSLIKYQQ